MWDEIARHLAQFSSAVLTGIDETGYPFSIRCQPHPEAVLHAFRIWIPPSCCLKPGPAGLLCHCHDERLWKPTSFVAQGHLERDENSWLFYPARFVPGIGVGGPLANFRYLMRARRTARQYLARRGLPRPRIPWHEIAMLVQQARQE